MSTITATCPNCEMQYQLTEEQLSVADGQVRCGACMTVFTARENPQTPETVSEDTHTDIDDNALINDEPDDFAINEDTFSDSFKNLSTNNADFFIDEIDNQDEEFTVEDDEDWAEQLLAEEDENSTPQAEEKAPETKPKARVINNSFDDIDFNAQDKTQLIDRITPEPLEFSLGHNTGLWINLGLAFASVFLVLVLLGQWFAFQFNDIASNPKYRDLSASICNVVGCTLPNPYNINDISAQHLTVKSHDIYNNSLLVDSILTNHRKTSQPFPNLELYFTDSNQKVVAARKFTPKEYLRGEMAKRTMMPGRQPIRIALELNETQAKSSGYFMQLSY